MRYLLDELRDVGMPRWWYRSIVCDLLTLVA